MQLKVRTHENGHCYCSYVASVPEASQSGPATGDAAPAVEANDAEDAEAGEGSKLLSKKEKERLKKEKEKVTGYYSSWLNLLTRYA
jgi:hypothetical protein